MQEVLLALLARLAPRTAVETWPQLLGAGHRRFWDGLALAVSGEGRNAGALYLLGYVAEIVLKVAYFRLEGIPPYGDVGHARRAARRLARLYALQRRNDHDLVCWQALVERRRSERGLEMDPAFWAAVRFHVRRVASNWVESLRYCDIEATGDELQVVADSVEWLVDNQRKLWS